MTDPRNHFVLDSDTTSLPLRPLTSEEFPAWRESASAQARQWVDAQGFEAKPATLCILPDDQGKVAGALIGRDAGDYTYCLGAASAALTAGHWHLDCQWNRANRSEALLGFALGAYQFDRYRKGDEPRARVRLTDDDDGQTIIDSARAIYLVRDLINTPAADMMPDELERVATELGQQFAADVTAIIGDDLLKVGYPAIHAVGRASAVAPRLIDLQWGEPNAPPVTLVGKGVCFDSGGLDIKPSAGMRWMKKDMGGAAHVLGLAQLVMSHRLPLRLRVLIPAVENAVSERAMRPGDVLSTRKGSTIEIGNTDAEGRVILADALYEACAHEPQLVVDFATLTGAARVALGTQVAAMFCNDDEIARQLMSQGERIADPVWRMPLHAPYKKLNESKIADISNSGSAPYAGAITAALFLEHFIDPVTPWVHFDIMAFNVNTRPGRPEGGEAMGVRAVFKYLCERYVD